MRVAVLFEFSGIVRDAFIKAGHNAVSCDILPTESNGPHLEGDVFSFDWSGYDLIIAHPPCTKLTLSGNRWLYDPDDKTKPHPMHPNRLKEQLDAVEFVKKVWAIPCDKMALENPVGVLSTKWMRATQYVQPYYFGDPAQKKTGFWLRGLEPLTPTNIVEPEIIVKETYRRPAWMNRTGGTPRRYIDHSWHYGTGAKERSKTFPGIASAMANQWGKPQIVQGDLF